MRLPLFRVDITVITLWPGHEQLSTTNVNLSLEESYRMRESRRFDRPLRSRIRHLRRTPHLRDQRVYSCDPVPPRGRVPAVSASRWSASIAAIACRGTLITRSMRRIASR